MSSQKIKKGFNRLAPFYDAGAFLFFGRSIIVSQTCFLPVIGNFKNVLIFGGGTGKILTALLKQNTGENYVYIDISEKMIAKTKRRVKDQTAPAKIKFICGSWTDVPALTFDLIVTPYVLDCFPEPELAEVMKALHARLAKEGKWLFADFNLPEKGVIRFLSDGIISTLYFFFRLAAGLHVKRLPDFENRFKAIGMKKEKEVFFIGGLLTSGVYSRQ